LENNHPTLHHPQSPIENLPKKDNNTMNTLSIGHIANTFPREYIYRFSGDERWLKADGTEFVKDKTSDHFVLAYNTYPIGVPVPDWYHVTADYLSGLKPHLSFWKEINPRVAEPLAAHIAALQNRVMDRMGIMQHYADLRLLSDQLNNRHVENIIRWHLFNNREDYDTWVWTQWYMVWAFEEPSLYPYVNSFLEEHEEQILIDGDDDDDGPCEFTDIETVGKLCNEAKAAYKLWSELLQRAVAASTAYYRWLPSEEAMSQAISLYLWYLKQDFAVAARSAFETAWTPFRKHPDFHEFLKLHRIIAKDDADERRFMGYDD
jgi:hypothetical protein